MNAVALVKHVPTLDTIVLDGDGAPRRDCGTWAMDALSRRAVAQGVELAAAVGDGTCTVITLGTPAAEDSLREAIAWGGMCSVMTDGVLVEDSVFTGADALATARALAAAIDHEGPFDLVLLGAASSDVGTGQIGPQIAELLDLPFVASARYLSLQGSWLHVRGEHEDCFTQATVRLPAVISCSAGLIDPCEAPADARALVPPERIRTLAARDLGPGPWGREASSVSLRSVSTGDVAVPVTPSSVPSARGFVGVPVGVVVEPERPEAARAMLGIGAALAAQVAGHVVALNGSRIDAPLLGEWGADAVVTFDGDLVAEDVGRAIADWVRDSGPWAVLAPGTAWGGEVAGRVAARLGVGLAGNVDALVVDGNRMVAYTRVYDARAVAELVSSATIQLATLRTGVIATPAARAPIVPSVRTINVAPRGRVRVASRSERK